MAQLTLQERIKRSQEVGQQAVPPPVSTLQQQAGVVGGLTTATSASALGATPDQAKMMGTPAQKEATLKAATSVVAPRGETELEQAKLLRAPTAATAEEEDKKRKASALSTQLGTYGDKVNQLIDTATKNIESTQAAAKVATPAETGAPLSSAELAKKITVNGQELTVTEALGKIAGNDPASQQMLVAINVATGKQLDPAQVPALYQSALQQAQDAVKTGIKATIGDTLTVEDLQGIGTSPEELANLFGLPSVEALNNLSLEDFQNRLNTIASQQFGETQEVKGGLATTSLLSSAEKEALREGLRSLEETGIAGAEFQVAELAKQIDAGNTVSFGGKDYSIEEILGDEGLNKIIEQVLDAPTGDTAKQLQATEPAFYQWLTGVKNDLARLTTTATTAVKTYGETQAANKQFLTPFAGQEKLLKSLGPAYEALFGPRAGVITKDDLKNTPVLALAYDLEQKTPGAAASALANLSQLPAKEVASLTPNELAALGLDRPNGLWSQYVNATKAVSNINSIPDNQPEVFLDALNIDQDLVGINSLITEDILAKALGAPGNNASQLDINRDGKFDAADIPELKKKYGSVSGLNLKEVIASGVVPQAQGLTVQPTDRGSSRLVGGLMDALKDGSISAQEMDAIAASPEINTDEMKQLLDKNLQGFPGANDINKTLQTSIQRKINNEIGAGLGGQGLSMRNIHDTITIDVNPLTFKQLSANLNTVKDTIQKAKTALEGLPSNAAKTALQRYIDRLEITKFNLEQNAASPTPLQLGVL